MLIIEKLKNQNNFSEIEKLLANYFINEQENIADQSTRQISKKTYTAPSTIVRFCQKLGYDGFNEFKETYLKELDYLNNHFEDIDPNYPFLPNDKNMHIASKMAKLYHEVVDDSLALTEHDSLQKAVDYLNQAHTIYLFSAGVQSELAETFKDKMLRINKNVVIEKKADALFYRASFENEHSVFIIISYSGETEVMLRIAKQIVKQHHPLIAVTAYGNNSLSQLADVCLHLSTREKLVENLGHFAVNLSLLFILDTLYANLFNLHYHQNLKHRITSSHGFEVNRKSNHPILDDNAITPENKAEKGS